MERSYRYRVNVSQTVKGVLTFEATVEIEGQDILEMDGRSILEHDVLNRSHALVADLRKRYPPAPEPASEKGKP